MWFQSKDKLKKWNKRYSERMNGIIEEKMGIFYCTMHDKKSNDYFLIGNQLNLNGAKDLCDKDWKEIIEANLEANYTNNIVGMINGDK